ncbi:MAG: hypothetical protein ABI172_12195, partial [Ginsengibacter sp.]
MKFFFILITTTLIFNFKSNSQITQDNWLVGGSASFSSLKSSSEAVVQFKQTNIQITPLVGYFLMD